MKAGILTFHQADNFGAVLQAHALQSVLSALGAESELVTFAREEKPAAPAGDGASRPPLFAKRIQAEGERRSARFAEFRQKHLVCSAPFSPGDAGLDGAYDLFIAGSDQIWNFRIPGADARYFLPFADRRKRCSYAASFGAEDIPPQARQWCAEQLSGFRALSVREKSGREIVRALTGREAAVCLDPTLLPPRAHWEAMAPQADCPPYLFLFMLKYSGELHARAKKYAAEKGLELRAVTAAFFPQLGFESWSGAGVEDWLALIKNASCVMTDSFHGTAFSIIFERPFCARRLEGELAGRNGRVEELLSAAGLASGLEGAPVESAGGWERLAEARAASLDYLRGVLAGD